MSVDMIPKIIKSIMTAKWVVDVKGDAGSECFEITVLRDDNELAKQSFGWIGEDKLLIIHTMAARVIGR